MKIKYSCDKTRNILLLIIFICLFWLPLVFGVAMDLIKSSSVFRKETRWNIEKEYRSWLQSVKDVHKEIKEGEA